MPKKLFLILLSVFFFIGICQAKTSEKHVSELHFLDILQKCTPGVYITKRKILYAPESHPIPDQFDAIKNIVTGLNDEHCHVEISSPKMKTMNCNYSKESIAYMINLAKNGPKQKREEGPLTPITEDTLEQEARLIGECGAVTPW